MNKNKKLLVGLCAVLVVLIAAAAILYTNFGPKAQAQKNSTTSAPVSGESISESLNESQSSADSKTVKAITVKVITDDGEKSFSYTTEGETLADVLLENKLAEGEESTYGLFIKSVNGITADDSKEQWWCITKGGESLTTGADTTYIADGETYELTLTTGYDQY